MFFIQKLIFLLHKHKIYESTKYTPSFPKIAPMNSAKIILMIGRVGVKTNMNNLISQFLFFENFLSQFIVLTQIEKQNLIL